LILIRISEIGWGSAPDPTGGAYSAAPDPLAAFKGPTSSVSKGGEGKGEKGRGGKGCEVLPALLIPPPRM